MKRSDCLNLPGNYITVKRGKWREAAHSSKKRKHTECVYEQCINNDEERPEIVAACRGRESKNHSTTIYPRDSPVHTLETRSHGSAREVGTQPSLPCTSPSRRMEAL